MDLNASVKPVGPSPLMAFLKARIASAPQPIRCALTVDGHDFWWILDAGSGAFFGSGPNVDIDLNPPPGIPHGSVGGPWPITPRKGRTALVSRKGRTLPVTLRFWDLQGNKHTPTSVTHPGSGANVGFVRSAAWRFRNAVDADLAQMRRNGLPSREQIVEMVNGHLRALLADVVARTPDQYEYNPSGHNEVGHLRDAWGITLAQ